MYICVSYGKSFTDEYSATYGAWFITYASMHRLDNSHLPVRSTEINFFIVDIVRVVDACPSTCEFIHMDQKTANNMPAEVESKGMVINLRAPFNGGGGGG